MTSAEADTTHGDMTNWILIIIAVGLCAHNVIGTYTSDVTSAATTRVEDKKKFDILDGDVTPTHPSTDSDDVRCTTINDVAATRRSLCPAQCRCSPFWGQEVVTKLTVNCSGAYFYKSALWRLSQELDQLLSRCASELTNLTISYTPLTGISEVLCRLSKLRSLDISWNRFWALPINCFTRMPNLTSFRADYNLLGILQVR